MKREKLAQADRIDYKHLIDTGEIRLRPKEKWWKKYYD